MTAVMKREDFQLFKLIMKRHGSRLGCPLDCHLISMNKNSSSIEQRKQLRVELVKEINKKWPDKLSKDQCNSLLIPGRPPRLPFVSLSIAHSSDIGGFIFSTPTHFIGFDLERQGRAKEKTVLRISSQKEVDDSPSPSALWSAKESAYKAIHLLNSDTPIKKISISSWQTASPGEIYDYQFQVEGVDNIGKGYVCFVKDIVMGLAFLN